MNCVLLAAWENHTDYKHPPPLTNIRHLLSLYIVICGDPPHFYLQMDISTILHLWMLIPVHMDIFLKKEDRCNYSFQAVS